MYHDFLQNIHLEAASYIVKTVILNCRSQLVYNKCIRDYGLCRSTVSVCLSIHPWVTFVDSAKTNKRIFKFFSPSSSHTILVFSHQTLWQYSDWVSNAGGVGKNHDSLQIFITSSCVVNGQVLYTQLRQTVVADVSTHRQVLPSDIWLNKLHKRQNR